MKQTLRSNDDKPPSLRPAAADAAAPCLARLAARKGHLAYYISDTVDAPDLSEFHARYAGGGPRNQPFHPAMMAKVLLYAYATGVLSPRKLHEDVAFRMLGAGNFPKHRTICDSRALHLHELAALFIQAVALARECGLVKPGTIAVDGTEIIVALGREGRDDVKIDAQKYPHTAAMAGKLGSDRGKAAYQRRKAIVEPPSGWIKHILGFRQFNFRGGA